ncbi:MAG: hypothetical protein VX223_06065 [Myxococcota bacterium]|nr:hypothetical protein [Myxococcota bacterium]
MTSFPGFEKKHYDAYEERKWASNRFNLERMRVREVVESLTSEAISSLEDPPAWLSVTPTQDHPTIFNHKRVDSQWVLIGRSEDEWQRIRPLAEREAALAQHAAESQPQLSRLNLALRLDLNGFEVAVKVSKLAALDRRNFMARLKDENSKATFLAMLHALPESAAISVEAQVFSAPSVDDAALDALISSLISDGDWFSVGYAWGRDHGAPAQPEFVEEVADCLRTLIPVYEFIHWSTSNDYLDGETFLTEDLQRQAETSAIRDESKPIPQTMPQSSAKQRPSTRGGWTYRPDWQFDPSPSEGPDTPRSPSARVRERASELQREARNWNYSGPQREAPTRERTSTDRPRGPRRDRTSDERRGGGRRNNRQDGGGATQQGHSRGRQHPRGHGPRGDRSTRRDAGSRNQSRNSTRQPAVTRGRKSVDKMEWVDAQGAVSSKDYIRITEGLFAGKIAQVMEPTKKGFRVVLGDGGMTVDVAKDGVTKIEEKT